MHNVATERHAGRDAAEVEAKFARIKAEVRALSEEHEQRWQAWMGAGMPDEHPPEM
jgi:hypothetical protein